jgi:hypothetical protein
LKHINASFSHHEWRFDLVDAGESVFTASGRTLTPAFPFHFSVPFIDDIGNHVEWYSGLFDTQIQFSKARIKINPDCQFGRLARAQRLLSVCFKSLRVVLGEPSAVQERLIPQPVYATPAVSANRILTL